MNFKNNEYSETTKAINVNENKKLSSHKQVVLIII